MTTQIPHFIDEQRTAGQSARTADVFDVYAADRPLRSVIAQSWCRVAEGGLHPKAPIDHAGIAEFNASSKLMSAAQPVLDDVAAAMEDTEFSLLLADRTGRLVDVRYGDRAARERLNRLGVVPGRMFTEAVAGTNAISTTLEVGRGVAVRGDEHFIESLQQFSCYGHPVIHPVTGRLEGVLGVTCRLKYETPLLAPFLISAVRQIEHRLLLGARQAEQLLLSAFQSVARARRSLPVAALSEDLFFANPAAIELLDAADHAVLRGMAVGAAQGERIECIQLSSGTYVRMRIERLGVGSVFVFEPMHDRPIIDVDRTLAGSVLVHGEPGAGHTSTVRRLLGNNEACWFEVSDMGNGGAQQSLAQLERALAASEVVVIEGVHALSEPLARSAAAAIGRASSQVILTSLDMELKGEKGRLVARCSERVGLVPLRHRREEIPKLVLSMMAELNAPRELRFTPAAMEALAANTWPGNLRELHSVVQAVVRARSVGDVTAHDLPEAYRTQARACTMSPIEQAERDAIVSALRRCGGNKLEAARRLGISRTTLYRSIRRYGVVVAPTPCEVLAGVQR
jgi:transcriptional regulator of acetoin/glycerol metabolism